MLGWTFDDDDDDDDIGIYDMVLRKAQDKVQRNSLVDDVVKVCKNALIEKKDNQNKKRRIFDHILNAWF